MTCTVSTVRFDDDSMWLELSDGRVLGVPLRAYFPLANAYSECSPECRMNMHHR
ncbi:MAG: hypothetical protein JWN23_3280 [Rhodocyclales bacterium]|nr:hypothetical protein [Rhodocyclales bacterium]